RFEYVRRPGCRSAHAPVDCDDVRVRIESPHQTTRRRRCPQDGRGAGLIVGGSPRFMTVRSRKRRFECGLQPLSPVNGDAMGHETDDLPSLRKSSRVEGVDILRGLVMVVMVLDHTRDYFGDMSVDPTNL